MTLGHLIITIGITQGDEVIVEQELGE